MSEKKRKAFLTWRADKVQSDAVFDYQKELSAYLESDDQVLKTVKSKSQPRRRHILWMGLIRKLGRCTSFKDVGFTDASGVLKRNEMSRETVTPIEP